MSSITAIQGNQIFPTTANQTAGATARTTLVTDTAKKQPAQEENLATSKDGDTLEISASGTILAQKTYAGQSSDQGELSDDEGYSDATASALSNAASSVGITEYSAAKSTMDAQADAVGGSTSGSDSTSELSGYSESELREMLQNGEITRAEYEEELASRRTSADHQDESDDSAAISGSDSADPAEA